MVSNTLYITLLNVSPATAWAMNISAALLCAAPLLIALLVVRKFTHPFALDHGRSLLRLSIFLLVVQHRPGGTERSGLECHAVHRLSRLLHHFWFAYRRATAGAFITIAGFLAWARYLSWRR
jgi:hypothetical protein